MPSLSLLATCTDERLESALLNIVGLGWVFKGLPDFQTGFYHQSPVINTKLSKTYTTEELATSCLLGKSNVTF